MAGVVAAADLLFFFCHREEDFEEEISAVDSVPFWSTDFDQDEIYGPDTFSAYFHDFPPSEPSLHQPNLIHDTSSDEEMEASEIGIGKFKDSDSVSNYFLGRDREEIDAEEEEEDKVSLILDLFDRRSEQILEVDDDSVANPFPEFGEHVDAVIDEGFGNDLVVGCKKSVSEPGESSRVVAVEPDGLRIVGIGSDSDSDDSNRVVGVNWNSDGEDVPERIDDDLDLPLCWDCLRFDDRRETAEDFEWEEVDRRAVDDRDPLRIVIDTDFDERSDSSGARSEQETTRNLDWEVLLAVNRLERNIAIEHDSESYLGEHDDEYIYTTEYEVLFGQFAETANSMRGSPPAAKSAIENLPSVVVMKEDVDNNNALCAVCKDSISIGEQVKQLPCSHHYHGDCILPWLKIRNTCPVCRYELPTDDPDYERWRREQVRLGHSRDSQARYDFEMFPEL